jgi:hypothetical protein
MKINNLKIGHNQFPKRRIYQNMSRTTDVKRSGIMTESLLQPQNEILLHRTRGREVNIPASYFGGPAFKSETLAILTGVFHTFPQSLQANTEVLSSN